MKKATNAWNVLWQSHRNAAVLTSPTAEYQVYVGRIKMSFAFTGTNVDVENVKKHLGIKFGCSVLADLLNGKLKKSGSCHKFMCMSLQEHRRDAEASSEHEKIFTVHKIDEILK